MYHETYASASMRSMDYMAFEGFHLQLNPNWNTRALKPEKSKGQHFFSMNKVLKILSKWALLLLYKTLFTEPISC